MASLPDVYKRQGYCRYWAPGRVVEKNGEYYLYTTFVKPDENARTLSLIHILSHTLRKCGYPVSLGVTGVSITFQCSGISLPSYSAGKEMCIRDSG